MRTIKLNYLKYFVLFFCLFFIEAKSETKISNNSKQLNFYGGVFDFSDDKMSSPFVGIQHASDELYRDTFLGRLSPVTGLFVTGAQSSYIYTGVQANYKIGNLNINPSFAPGYYSKKGGKDLGTWLEFKSEVQMSYDVGDKGTKIGMSYNHLSNASLGDKNPGANSYLFNILKSF